MTTFVQTSDRSVKANLIQRYPLASFFVLAIGLTWIFLITDALGSHGILPFRLSLPLMVVMGYMPTLAAVIVAGMTEGKQAVKALFRKLLITRVGLRWYLFAIFGLSVIYAAAVFFYNLFGGSPALSYLSARMSTLSPLQLVISTVSLFVMIGIFNGEELGWRGFALPRLQSKYNALTSSLILGVIWTVFHLPLFFTTTGSSQVDMNFVGFLISTTALTVLYTWMYNNTRGSVLMAYLFHAAANTWTQVFPIDHGSQLVGNITIVLLVLVAAIVAFTNGAENLSRKNVRIQE